MAQRKAKRNTNRIILEKVVALLLDWIATEYFIIPTDPVIGNIRNIAGKTQNKNTLGVLRFQDC